MTVIWPETNKWRETMMQLEDIRNNEDLLNAIDWDMTPEEAVRLYLEWGNNWAGGNYVIRSKDDITHYFVVNTWDENPILGMKTQLFSSSGETLMRRWSLPKLTCLMI